ncbi:MAG TPA: beta-1,6-N-acetylglucosaminyltransferase [Chitinophagaceae bacterium]|nr:beta-1,6-N-acetylglucosaminyltransferase [Chitinophagaceae bacterium]
MRIAHLILAHSEPDQLNRLIKRLWHDDADFYIHLDLKTSITDFLFLGNNEHVFFIKKREKVYWGAYSIVQATVNGFEEIIKSGKHYDFINLLSGQDYPLKTANEIHDFLKANTGKAFMHTLSIKNEWIEAIPRVTKYHLTNYSFRGKFAIERMLNICLPDRKMPNGLIAVGRSQWFTISFNHVKYIVDYLHQNKKVKRFFTFTWGSDEIVFQTILYNSIFREDMVNDNLRYIDWSEGKANPKTFTIKDADTLLHCGKLFARKFNSKVDSAILNFLDNAIENNKG